MELRKNNMILANLNERAAMSSNILLLIVLASEKCEPESIFLKSSMVASK